MNTLQQHVRRAASVLALATLLGACSHGPHHPGGHDVTLTGAQEVPANTSTASDSMRSIILDAEKSSGIAPKPKPAPANRGWVAEGHLA